MASPIASTPILEGEDAKIFWEADSEKEQRLPLVPTPNLKETREKMLEDDKRRKK
jgi:hypothetical protein